MMRRHSLIDLLLLLLCACVSSAQSLNYSDLAQRNTLAAPIVATPSEVWEGIDGTWSTFEIRVGTPNQVFRVLPATSWQETWVVWNYPNAPELACPTNLGVESDCDDDRGGTFSDTDSSSWEDIGLYALDLNTALGYSGNGSYGFDFVGLGYTNTSGPTLGHQIVAEIVSDTFWFGLLGLGFQPTNFSGYNDPQPSFSESLNTNGTISSSSWSYTAGAYYRLKSVFGSLIFGGYDASRFTPNDVIFTMTGDNERDVVLTIRSITSTTASGNTTLMSEPEFAFIDSTVPELWLPVDVCQAFEDAFGIEMDQATGLYLVNSSTHDSLLSLNPNITLTLADEKTSGATVDIILPYASFDLNVTAPRYNGSSYYFPIRQATDESQYTLGRTFLQEAYVTVDYNTRTFNVSQCIFEDGSQADVHAIPSTTASSGSDPQATSSGVGHGSNGLSGGAIAGIVLGGVFALLLIGLLIFNWRKRLLCFRQKTQRPPSPVYEIGGQIAEPKPEGYTGQASALTSELSGRDAKVEIGGNPIMPPQELPADIPITARQKPVELPLEAYHPRKSSGSGEETSENGHSEGHSEVSREERAKYTAHPAFATPPRIMELRTQEEHAVSPVSPRTQQHGFSGVNGYGANGYSPVSEPTEGSSPRQSYEDYRI